MANAEDFAYDCTLDELTFRYYNCVPQHPRMNRGPWKKVETEIRKWSQDKELLVICINIFGDKDLPNTNVAIPTECIKLVYDYKTKKPIAGYVFTNTANPVMTQMTPDEIVKKYSITIQTFLN